MPLIEIELDDDGWEIVAVRDGKEVSLTADPNTGTIGSAEEEENEAAGKENEEEEKEEHEKQEGEQK